MSETARAVLDWVEVLNEVQDWDWALKYFIRQWRTKNQEERRVWLHEVAHLRVPIARLMEATLHDFEKAELEKMYIEVVRLKGDPQQVLAIEVWLAGREKK